MVSRSKKMIFYPAAACLFFLAGLACDKFGGSNPSGISKGQVVATVGDHQITFGDWMAQVDLLRVFTGSVDSDNSRQVEAVLDSLIDQQLVLDAAQKAKFSSPAFDETLKKKLIEADLKVKETKERLKKDSETLQRMEKNYQEGYKKMLLARAFAASQVDKVEVTQVDLKNAYDEYAVQAKRAGQKMPPFASVSNRLKPGVQAEKFLRGLQDGTKVSRQQDVIKKYLGSLSITQQMLGGKNDVPEDEDKAPAEEKKASDK